MWDLERKNPALLLPGMAVHFEDVTHQPTTVSVPQQVTRTVESKQSMPLFTVTAPSLQMLIQDEGRFNQTKLVWVLQGRWMYRRCTVQIELSVTQLRRL
jgi:hypothetical protein